MITKATIYSGVTRLTLRGSDEIVSVGERIEFSPDGTVRCAVQTFRTAALGEHRDFNRRIEPSLARNIIEMLDAVSRAFPPTDDLLYIDGWGIIIDDESTERIVSGFHFDLMYRDIRLSNYLRAILKTPELCLFDGRADAKAGEDYLAHAVCILVATEKTAVALASDDKSLARGQMVLIQRGSEEPRRGRIASVEFLPEGLTIESDYHIIRTLNDWEI